MNWRAAISCRELLTVPSLKGIHVVVSLPVRVYPFASGTAIGAGILSKGTLACSASVCLTMR